MPSVIESLHVNKISTSYHRIYSFFFTVKIVKKSQKNQKPKKTNKTKSYDKCMRAYTEENISICSLFSCYFIKTINVLIFSSSSLFEFKITLGDQQKI